MSGGDLPGPAFARIVTWLYTVANGFVPGVTTDLPGRYRMHTTLLLVRACGEEGRRYGVAGLLYGDSTSLTCRYTTSTRLTHD